VVTNDNADLNLPLPSSRLAYTGSGSLSSLEKAMHATSALSRVAAVWAVEFDTRLQRHTSSNQTATASENTPAALVSVPPVCNCCGAAVICNRYNVSQLYNATNKRLLDAKLSITSRMLKLYLSRES